MWRIKFLFLRILQFLKSQFDYLDFDTRSLGLLDGALSVDGIAEGIDDSAEQTVADRHVDDGARSLDDVALPDDLVVTEHDNTHVVRLQVQSHSLQKID